MDCEIQICMLYTLFSEVGQTGKFPFLKQEQMRESPTLAQTTNLSLCFHITTSTHLTDSSGVVTSALQIRYPKPKPSQLGSVLAGK